MAYKTAKIFQEEISNLNIWKTIIRDLGLPEDTDEIGVKMTYFKTKSGRENPKRKLTHSEA